jgi:hypothetical protein
LSKQFQDILLCEFNNYLKNRNKKSLLFPNFEKFNFLIIERRILIEEVIFCQYPKHLTLENISILNRGVMKQMLDAISVVELCLDGRLSQLIVVLE